VHVVSCETLAARSETRGSMTTARRRRFRRGLDELDLRTRSPPRRVHVVEYDDARFGRHRVLVHLEAVRAVLERVRGLNRLARKLARLARGDEACAKRIGERRAEMKPRASAPKIRAGSRGRAQSRAA
jgi:hypothetical protein